MPIAKSPMKKTIETPRYNMASIIVFSFHPANAAFYVQEMAGTFKRATTIEVVGSCLKT